MSKQLADLATRIPKSYIKQKPGGFAADYVSHADINQILLAKLGPFDQRVAHIIYNPEGVLDGVVLELTFEIDGKTVTIQEAGDVERPSKNNGSNLKNACSDAIKRCAMRVGCGLHLWSQANYVLDKALTKEQEDGN
jgi:hypothetical protein